jgi:hypothetical protein
MKFQTTLAALVLTASLASAEDISFEKQILPILKTSCFKCHETEHEDNGRIKRPKGGLVLDTAEGILAGGKEYPKENVVAGKPDDSWLLKTMVLPESDDLAMPPEGKGDRVSAADQELIKKWIAAGANFGGWTKAAK